MKYRNIEKKDTMLKSLNLYISILREGKNQKYLILSFVIVSLIMTIEICKGLFLQPKFVTDNDGNLIAIERPYRKKAEQIHMIAEIKNGKNISEVPVDIKVSSRDSLRNKEQSKKISNHKSYDEGKAVRREEELRINRNIRRELRIADENKNRRYVLPKKLRDGETIRWRYSKESGFPKAILLFPVIPTGIVMLSKSEKRRIEKEEVEALRCAIPKFTHQFVLYLNSGLIVTDILEKLSKRYGLIEERNPLEEMVVQAEENAKMLNTTSIVSLQKLAEMTAVSEFMRIITIIYDSQIRGIDIRNKLENESKILWHDRKKVAEEKGHIAESKLAFPLSILLIVLMLITAAPAMMEL